MTLIASSAAIGLVAIAQTSSSGVPRAAISPFIAVSVRFVAYFLFDLTRSQVRLARQREL